MAIYILAAYKYPVTPVNPVKIKYFSIAYSVFPMVIFKHESFRTVKKQHAGKMHCTPEKVHIWNFFRYLFKHYGFMAYHPMFTLGKPTYAYDNRTGCALLRIKVLLK